MNVAFIFIFIFSILLSSRYYYFNADRIRRPQPARLRIVTVYSGRPTDKRGNTRREDDDKRRLDPRVQQIKDLERTPLAKCSRYCGYCARNEP